MAYLAGDPQTTVARQVTEGPASSGQTVIPIAGGFTPGMVDVFVGGAALSHGDFDDSDGMSIRLTLAMAVGTQYRVVSYAPGQVVQTVQLNTLPGNRNYIVDGAIENVASGSTALSGNSGIYTCNAMWIGNAGTGGAATVTNTSLRGNAGLSPFDTGPNGCYTHQQTTASTGSLATADLPSIAQHVEFINKFAGKSVTLSAKIWASVNCTIPGILFRQNYGTGGSPAAPIIADKAVSWAVTPSPRKFSVRLDVPAISGALGTNPNSDFTNFGFYFPGGWTGTIYVTEVQVELSNPLSSSDINGAGGAPTPFEYRGQQAELARAQRYYKTGECGFDIPAYAMGAAMGAFTSLGTTMRAAPALATASLLENTNVTSLTYDWVSATDFRYRGSSSAVGNAYVSVNYVADARL